MSDLVAKLEDFIPNNISKHKRGVFVLIEIPVLYGNNVCKKKLCSKCFVCFFYYNIYWCCHLTLSKWKWITSTQVRLIHRGVGETCIFATGLRFYGAAHERRLDTRANREILLVVGGWTRTWTRQGHAKVYIPSTAKRWESKEGLILCYNNPVCCVHDNNVSSQSECVALRYAALESVCRLIWGVVLVYYVIYSTVQMNDIFL